MVGGGKIKLKFRTNNLKLEHRRCDGFTLMEILIVLFVVSIMLSGLIPLFMIVIRANDSTNYYARAYKDLDAQMEIYRRTPFDNVNTGTFTISDIPSSTGNVTVSNVIDNVPQADIKKVDLNLSWTYNNKTSSVKLSSYIYRNGIGK